MIEHVALYVHNLFLDCIYLVLSSCILFVCLFVCSFVRLFVCLFVCLTYVCIFIYIHGILHTFFACIQPFNEPFYGNLI